MRRVLNSNAAHCTLTLVAALTHLEGDDFTRHGEEGKARSQCEPSKSSLGVLQPAGSPSLPPSLAAVPCSVFQNRAKVNFPTQS